MYESVIEEMLAAALEARRICIPTAFTANEWRSDKQAWGSMLTAARAVAERRINEISEQWKGCAESLAMFLAPYQRNRVRKGLTWNQAWKLRHEFAFYRSGPDKATWRFDSHHDADGEYWSKETFEVSTSADFSGEVEP